MAFSTVQEAIDSIGRLGMAVVVDDEDRENEGDLVMAAEAATPENIAFFLTHTSGVICVPLAAGAGGPAGPASHGDGQHRGPAHGLHRERGPPARHDHGDLRRRPGIHHCRPHRPRHPPERPQPARPHLPAALPHRRRPQAGRAHRGDGRPLPRRRALTGRRAVRDRDRGQVRDGPPGRPGALRQEARPPVDLHRGPHPLPAAEREARAPRLRGAHPGGGPGVPRLRLRVGAGQRAAPGPRHGRRGRDRGRAGARPLRVPHR